MASISTSYSLGTNIVPEAAKTYASAVKNCPGECALTVDGEGVQIYSVPSFLL